MNATPTSELIRESSSLAVDVMNTLLPQPDLSSVTWVLNREGTQSGTVFSTSRRCRMDGCAGIRIGVRWPDGHRTYPCSRGMREISADTWQIG